MNKNKQRLGRVPTLLDEDDFHILRLLNMNYNEGFWLFKDLRNKLKISHRSLWLHLTRLYKFNFVNVKEAIGFKGAYKQKIAIITKKGREIFKLFNENPSFKTIS